MISFKSHACYKDWRFFALRENAGGNVSASAQSSGIAHPKAVTKLLTKAGIISSYSSALH